MDQFKLGDYFAPEFEGMPEREVRDNLDAVCYSKTEEEYTKSLNQNELNAKKNELAKVSIKISKLEAELKEVKANYKEMLKEPKRNHSEFVEALKFKTERREGVLYHIDDQESRMMYSFDENGICVDSRPLFPSEKQQKIKTLNQKLN